MNELAGFARTRALSWPWAALLVLALLLGLGSIIAFAAPYFFDARAVTHFGVGRRAWLFVHICAASFALLAGPMQLWMGWTGHYVRLHRKLGTLYIISIIVASVTAVNLVATTQRGLVFGFALGALTIAWVVTTGLAYLAVLRRQFAQHWEWMIRSYVLTFVFVTFRLMVMLMKALKVGTSADRLTIAIWLCWIAPLFVTEAIMQGRKIFAVRSARRHPFHAAHPAVNPDAQSTPV